MGVAGKGSNVRFSVIVPARNEEKNIVACLSALRSQACGGASLEIIVVDNGSVDRTVELARQLEAQVHCRPELSLSGLRNFGAARSRGEVLAFLDADCIVAPDWLQQAARALADASIGCTGSTPQAPGDGPWVEQVWSSFRTRRKERCLTSWINSSNFIVRRELFEKVGGFGDQVATCEDVDICLRLNRICCILFDPSVRVVHLGEPKSVRQFFRKELWRGKGTLAGLRNHGLVASELKSLLLPLFYLATWVLLPLCLAFPAQAALLALSALAGQLLPAVAFSLWATAQTGRWDYLLHYALLFLVYGNARALALIPGLG